jgi:acyl-coenzyme A thioesterase PaaI-like protein
MNNQPLIKKMKWKIFLLGKFKIPMIGFINPKLLELNDDSVKIKVRLKRRTKNHLNSMYFGALAVGADLAGGIHAFYFAEKNQLKVSFAFKGMSSQFIMRAESDCIFVCNDGKKVEAAILKSKEIGERINETTKVEVFNENMEKVALFEMIVSVKCK